MEHNRAAIYCRLSVEDMDKIADGNDSESIQNQKLLLMDHAMHHNWSIHKIYADDDYSGMDRHRPAFNRMLADAAAGQFNIILCKTQSRFTRDMELVEKYLHGLFPAWGIRFVSVVDNVDTNVKGNKKARQIYGLINEWYCEDLSENIRAVFKRKMLDGQFLGSFASYGYRKDPLDRHKLVIDEEAAKTVRLVYMLYMQGLGCRQIAQKLTAMEIPTPTLHKRACGLQFENPNAAQYSASYGIWSDNSIRRILQNEVYIGTLIQGRERKASYKSAKVVIAPKEEWIVIPNNHEPIIDAHTFHTVQNLLRGRRMTHAPKNARKAPRRTHPLSGKVRCGQCHTNMTRSAPARNGGHYLRCSLAYKTKDSAQVCTPHTIQLEKLSAIVEDRLRHLLDDYLSDATEAAFLQKHCRTADNCAQQIAAKEKGLFTAQNRHAELTKAVADAYLDKTRGFLTESDFVSIKEHLHDEIAKLTEKQATLANDIETIKAQQHSLRDANGLLWKYTQCKPLTHAMVNGFIDYIEVFDANETKEQTITIHWRL